LLKNIKRKKGKKRKGAKLKKKRRDFSKYVNCIGE
jgi:hypothetical protein